MSDASLDELLSKFCDEEPSEAVYEDLGRRLNDDPAARQAYLDCLAVHAILQWDHAVPGHEAGNPLSADTFDTVSPSASEGHLQNKNSSLLNPLSTDASSTLSNWSRPQFSFGVLLAAVLISCGLTLVVTRWRQASTIRGIAVSETPSRDAELVATLVNAADVRWGRDEQPMAPGPACRPARCGWPKGSWRSCSTVGSKFCCRVPLSSSHNRIVVACCGKAGWSGSDNCNIRKNFSFVFVRERAKQACGLRNLAQRRSPQ